MSHIQYACGAEIKNIQPNGVVQFTCGGFLHSNNEFSCPNTPFVLGSRAAKGKVLQEYNRLGGNGPDLTTV